METLARLGVRVTCGFRKLLRANPAASRRARRVRTPSTWRRGSIHVDIYDARDASHEKRYVSRARELARHAAGGERTRKNRRTKTARGRGRAAEKTAFRACVNYASYAITMQKNEREREKEEKN